MQKLDEGTYSSQDLSGAFVDAAPHLTAPAEGSVLYRLIIRLSSLDVGHEIQVNEIKDGVAVPSQAIFSSGAAADQIEYEALMEMGDTDIIVQIKDTSGLSTDADWTYELWDVTPTSTGGGGSGGGNVTVTVTESEQIVRE